MSTPASLKILAVGNSFSADAMQYLAQIALDGGLPSITLGNLYIGGCSLARHLHNAQHDVPDYTYYKTTDGHWSETRGARLAQGLADEDWDIITLQQSSPLSGIPTSYMALTPLIDVIRTRCPRARLFWHMTWAYQQGSTHRAFENYSCSQPLMYTAICDALPIVDESGAFAGVIPTGTAIQNARSGFFGDTLNRDGFHLSYTAGRFLAGLTWYAALTGRPLANLRYNPAPCEITPDVMALFCEAVEHAIDCPRALTPSRRLTGQTGRIGVTVDDEVPSPAALFAADRSLFAEQGISPDGLQPLPLDFLRHAIWQGTKSASLLPIAAGDAQFDTVLATSVRFSRTALPNGSYILCDGGWQYRVCRWLDPFSPSAVSAEPQQAGLYAVDDAWWGDNTLCAFNLASSPKTDLSPNPTAAASHLRVYVPVSVL